MNEISLGFFYFSLKKINFICSMRQKSKFKMRYKLKIIYCDCVKMFNLRVLEFFYSMG